MCTYLIYYIVIIMNLYIFNKCLNVFFLENFIMLIVDRVQTFIVNNAVC